MPSKWQRETQTLSLFKAEQKCVKERDGERERERERKRDTYIYMATAIFRISARGR